MAAAIPFIGMGLGAYGSMSQGLDQQAAYEAQAANKRAQAAEVEIAADRELELTERRGKEVQGAQAMAFGRSGVQVGTGSPLEIMEQTAADTASEMSAIRHAASYRNLSLLTEGLYSQGLGDQAMKAGFIGAGTSIVNGAGNMNRDSGRVRRANQSQGGFYGGQG